MKTLTLYILKSTILPFLLGFGGFLLYANVFILIDISSQVVMNNLSFWRIFPFLFYQLPRYIPQAIPVGVLMSIFWLFSKSCAMSTVESQATRCSEPMRV